MRNSVKLWRIWKRRVWEKLFWLGHVWGVWSMYKTSTARCEHFVFRTCISHTSCSLQRSERRLKVPTRIGRYTSTCLVPSAVSAFLALDIITPYPVPGAFPSYVRSNPLYRLPNKVSALTEHVNHRNRALYALSPARKKQKGETILRQTWRTDRRDWRKVELPRPL